MTRSESRPKRVLNVPAPGRVVGAKNFIKLAVCELRFPVILDPDPKLPSELQKKVKGAYPHYTSTTRATRTSVSVDGADDAISTQVETRHTFLTRDKAWSLSFGPSTLAVETNKYTEWAEFQRRLQQAIDYSAGVIDSPFFTRVGLRYVNAISSELYGDELAQWVNEDLCRPLAQGVFGSVEQCVQMVSGWSDAGRFHLRHGLPVQPNEEYVIDIDSYWDSDVVETADVVPLVTNLNRVAFRLFHWCIGPAAREYAKMHSSIGAVDNAI